MPVERSRVPSSSFVESVYPGLAPNGCGKRVWGRFVGGGADAA